MAAGPHPGWRRGETFIWINSKSTLSKNNYNLVQDMPCPNHTLTLILPSLVLYSWPSLERRRRIAPPRENKPLPIKMVLIKRNKALQQGHLHPLWMKQQGDRTCMEVFNCHLHPYGMKQPPPSSSSPISYIVKSDWSDSGASCWFLWNGEPQRLEWSGGILSSGRYLWSRN